MKIIKQQHYCQPRHSKGLGNSLCGTSAPSTCEHHLACINRGRWPTHRVNLSTYSVTNLSVVLFFPYLQVTMEVNTISDKEFVKCVNNGDYSTVKKQLKLGADPNIYDEEGNPLLFLPIINGDDEMMDILLSFGKYWPLPIFVHVDTTIRKKPHRIPWRSEEKTGLAIVVICFQVKFIYLSFWLVIVTPTFQTNAI